MKNFEFETKEIIDALKPADGYLDCENIIISNIKKHVIDGVEIKNIEDYLKKLQKYFEDKMEENKGNKDSINYKYAAGFLNTINVTPYWRSWIKINN